MEALLRADKNEGLHTLALGSIAELQAPAGNAQRIMTMEAFSAARSPPRIKVNRLLDNAKVM